MKILHISDLHFPTKIPLFDLKGKMFSGYINYAFRRKSRYPKALWNALLLKIKSTNYDSLVISGDLTNVSHPLEFQNIADELSPILDQRSFIIPGNHDRYMIESISPKDLFKNSFSSFMGEKLQISNGYIYQKKLGKILLIGWDSNIPTGIGDAYGKVNTDVIHSTIQYLKNQNLPYILVCHHPIWNPLNHKETESHKLQNREEIQSELMKYPPLIYMHGHKHTNWIRRKDSNFPFDIVNSASSAMLSDKKRNNGFHEIDIDDNLNISYKRYSFDGTSFKEDGLKIYDS
jgi:3',5'-cyclic AMP phosphodiesterase CpdA